jgi:hypothetical protein
MSSDKNIYSLIPRQDAALILLDCWKLESYALDHGELLAENWVFDQQTPAGAKATKN